MAKKRTSYKAKSWETSRTNDHYTRLHDELLNSAAYKSLSHAARTVYTVLKMQYRGDFTGDEVVCPYATFNAYHMQNRTISKAIAELENKGFIKAERGALQTGNLHREPNKYQFINKWRDFKP